MQNSINLISSAVSDRGLSEKRPQNEDSYLEMPECGLFAVADGVGGAQAGDVASQMAIELLAEAFINHNQGDVEELMREAITRANAAIYQMSRDLPQLSTMATTIVALQISGNIATIGHAGDSRLYRLDSRGNLFRETQDHSVVEEEVRAGRMTPEQAENHPSKNVISRALGADGVLEVDMKTIMFEPNTTFLLCSDGITRHISDVEIRELLSLQHPPVVICNEMKQICHERGAEDNLTAVIVRTSPRAVEEEETVVVSRGPLAAPVASSQPTQLDLDDAPTQNLQIAEETLGYQTSGDRSVKEPVTNSMKISANPSFSGSEPIEKDERTYTIESAKPNALSSLLPFLFGLILGGIIGIGGSFAYQSLMPEPESPPQITKAQSSDVAYKTFEDARRNVDQDPQGFISKAEATANDAEDFYLLGRAFIWMRDYPKAREFFAKAKTALNEYTGENKTLLTNEIALANSSIKNEFSITVLESEKATTANKPNAGANKK